MKWMHPIPVIFLVLLTSCGIFTSPTPVIVRETVEVIITKDVEVTRQVHVSPTPEPSSTATPAPPLILRDDFEGDIGGWDIQEYENGAINIINGLLVIEANHPDWLIPISHPALESLDAYTLDVDISHMDGSENSVAYISFRWWDSENHCAFEVTADGWFALYCIIENEFYNTISWTRSPAIQTGMNTNHIRLVDTGQQVTFNINDNFLANIPITFLTPGDIRLGAGILEQGETAWSFDNIVVREYRP